jgi:DNA-binding response OmpR family regulator
MPTCKREHARILIVEDEPLIALNLEELLAEAGFEIAAVAGKLERALMLVESGACDAAIVDANLGGVSARPLACALTARGLPFIVLSGYSSEQLKVDFPGALFLQKPCRPDQLIQTVNTIAPRPCNGAGSGGRKSQFNLVHAVGPDIRSRNKYPQKSFSS